MRYGVLCNKLSRVFNGQKALSSVNLSLPDHGVIGILGKSGSGKSTLLNILAGLDPDYEGEVRILGLDPSDSSESERAEFRIRNIGYVFQSFELLEREDALSNVLLPIDAIHSGSMHRKRKKAADLLNFVGMKTFRNQNVSNLSGGQKQRIAIARALANDPKIILADEPTGSLDEENAKAIFALLRQASSNALVIIVTHDESLAREILDEGYFLEDGRIVRHERFLRHEKTEPIATMMLPRKLGRSKTSASFLCRHAFRLFRSKPFRSLISEGAIALGLIGVGLSTYMSSTIQDELSATFSTIVPESVITMSPSSTSVQGVSNVYGGRIEEAEYLRQKYPKMVKGTGSSIQIPFEEWFTDANVFTYLAGSTQQVLPGFSARTINDFLWLEDYPGKTFYPEGAKRCDGFDEVILGLPYSAMSNVCFGLHIERNYESLGYFIATGGFHLILDLARYEWEFENTDLFTVIGVTQTEYPCFFHTDHYWNRHYFLDHLRFRSWLSSDTPNPQYALELPYLSLSCPAEEFMPIARKEKELDHILFECASSALLPNVCPVGKPCEINRLYLYGADKIGCSWFDLDKISGDFENIKGRSPVTQGGYYADASSIAMGFANKFYLCESADTSKQVIDLYSDLPKDQAGLLMERIEGTFDGSYLASASNGLRISADLEDIDGRIPMGLEEVALSSSLFESMHEPREVFVCAEIHAEEIGDTISRTFATVKLKVTGIKDGRSPIMYVPSDWTVDFFQVGLGMSSFYLQPVGCVFYLEKSANPKEIIKKLSTDYPSYRFGSPKDDVKDSMSTTLSYLGVVLGAFSAVALLMSGLLLAVILAIQMNENSKEDEMLYVLGIPKRDIGRAYICHCFLYTGIGIVGSFGFLVILELVARVYIANSFSTSITGMISFMPMLVSSLVGLALTSFIALCLYLLLLNKHFTRDSRNA